MGKKKLNDSVIRGLTTDKDQEDFWDASLPGFGVRVSNVGAKTFVFRYRLHGKRRRIAIGRYPVISLAAGRRAAKIYQQKIWAGVDPQLEKEQAKVKPATVSEAFELYFQDRKRNIREKTLKNYRNIFTSIFEKEIGSLPIEQLQKRHVIKVLKELEQRGPTQAERSFQLLRGVLNFAVSIDLLKTNPLQGMQKVGKTAVGERCLTPEEMKRYLDCASDMIAEEKVYFMLLLMLGCRPGELLKWKWRFVAKEKITIPSGFQKNSRALVIPILPEINRLLEELKTVTGSTDYLFPGSNSSAPRTTFRRAKERLGKNMESTEPWELRDIRRSVETIMREIGCDDLTVSALLNHGTSRLSRTYDKSQLIPQKTRTLQKYFRWLDTLIKEEKQKVVNLF